MTTVDETMCIKKAMAEFRGGWDTGKKYVFLEVPECVQYPPLWREDHRAYSAVKRMDGVRRVPGAPVGAVDWTSLNKDGVWDRADGNFWRTAELSDAEIAPLSHCVSAFPRILGCTVALQFCMRLLAFSAGHSEDTIVQAWSRKTSAVKGVDTQFVSYTAELTRWSNPGACVVSKQAVPYVEGNLPLFERAGTRGEIGGRTGMRFRECENYCPLIPAVPCRGW